MSLIEKTRVGDPDAFDATREPLRALRDLVVAVEASGFGSCYLEDRPILDRAQEGVARLRYLFGDERPADRAAPTARLREPGDIITALRHAVAEIHNPGAARASGLDILAMIDAALNPPFTQA